MRSFLDRRRPLRTVLAVLTAALFLCFAPVLAFASDTGTQPDTSPTGLAIALITTVGAASVSLVTAGVKKLAPSIPRALLPTIVVPALGVIAAWVTALTTTGRFSGITAALMTLGALYLRETLSTVGEHGLDPVES